MIQASPKAMHCVLEQDTLSASKVLVQPRKTSPKTTEKLLTET